MIISRLKVVDLGIDSHKFPDKMHFLEDKYIQENSLKVSYLADLEDQLFYLIALVHKPLFWQNLIVS